MSRIFRDYAYWKIREYNELKHQVRERVYNAEKALDAYTVEVQRR